MRKKLVEREEEERRKSRKIKDINRVEEQEKELLLQIYACKMVDVKVDTEDIKNNKEKGMLACLSTQLCVTLHRAPASAALVSVLCESVHHITSSINELHRRVTCT